MEASLVFASGDSNPSIASDSFLDAGIHLRLCWTAQKNLETGQPAPE